MASYEDTRMDFLVLLPVEVLEKIIKQLTVKDLASCSCVSRQWREMLNQDWVWTTHYDHQLVESLQSIPCMPTEPFKIPEHPTLSPICPSKLAIMMEKHLWKNWRHYSNMYVQEIKPNITHTTLEGIDFLTDTLILMYSANGMEIIDVSVTPPVLVASEEHHKYITRTRSTFIFRGFSNQAPLDEAGRKSQIGTLLEIRERTLVIYSVDPIEKSISLRYNNKITEFDMKAHCITGDYYISLINNSLTLLDLNTVRNLNVSLPMIATQNVNIVDYKLTTSETNDFVVVCVTYLDINVYKNKHFIFSLERLVFLPSPVIESQERWNGREPESSIVLFRQYLALVQENMLTIMDFSTENIILTRTRKSSDGLPIVFNGAFVFVDRENEEAWLRMFDPESDKITNLYRCEDCAFMVRCRFTERFRIIKINKKFLGLFNDSLLRFEMLWEISGQSVKKSNIDTEYLSKCVLSGAKVNQSFTKVIFKEEKDSPFPGFSGSSVLNDCLSSSLTNTFPSLPRLHLNSLSDINTKSCVRNFW